MDDIFSIVLLAQPSGVGTCSSFFWPYLPCLGAPSFWNNTFMVTTIRLLFWRNVLCSQHSTFFFQSVLFLLVRACPDALLRIVEISSSERLLWKPSLQRHVMCTCITFRALPPLCFVVGLGHLETQPLHQPQVLVGGHQLVGAVHQVLQVLAKLLIFRALSSDGTFLILSVLSNLGLSFAYLAVMG